MGYWHGVVLIMSLALGQPAMATVVIAALPDTAEPVPAEDYAFYDLAVEEKFLTSQTKLVVIERMTATHLERGTRPGCNRHTTIIPRG